MTRSAGPGSDRRPRGVEPASHDPGDNVSWALPGKLPGCIEPMLPSPATEPFDSPSHIFEVIWPGVRALLFVERGEVRVQDTYGRITTGRFPELQVPRSHLNGSGIVLDGAIVCLNDTGQPDFRRLHDRLVLKDEPEAALIADKAPVTFQAFDILYRNGLSVMDEPLRRRKGLLRQTVRIQGALAVPDFVEREGVAFFEAARAHGLEGIIAKEADSRYIPGVRSRSWLSMRVYQRDEFVIGGYTYAGALKPGHRDRQVQPFASLLLGQFDDAGVLRFAGEVSGGLDAVSATDVVDALDVIRSAESPFAGEPDARRLVFWCRPELAVTVRFAARRPEGQLRFPVLECLRPDVPVEKCRLPGDPRP